MNCKKNPNGCPCNLWCIAVGAKETDCPDYAPTIGVDLLRYIPTIDLLDQYAWVILSDEIFQLKKLKKQ